MNPQSLRRIQEECLPLIELKLMEFFDQKVTQKISWNAEMSRYHFLTGGKRLRALIPCWVYAAYGKDPLDAIPLGCALELIHNATLVHDDLQDRDSVRRGKPTVWMKYSEPQAINCGDALFQFAFQLLFELKVNPENFRRIIQRMVHGTLHVIEGQAQEFLMKDEAYPDLDRYFGVVRGKTAWLISTAVVASLEALGLNSNLCNTIEKAALKSGILFQIQDDLLDVYGDKQRESKATDIAEGKISALVAYFNQVASSSEKSQVAQILSAPRKATTQAQIADVLTMFNKYQILDHLLEKIREFQSSVENDPTIAQYQESHQLLIQLNRLFLEPIEHLL